MGEITHSLLVAIMFIMILSIGIASLLVAMAAVIKGGAKCKRYGLHTSWMILLLLVNFNLFWQTLALFSIEDWMFLSFLYAIAGPVILLFAASLLIPEFSGEDSLDLRKHYFAINRQFYCLLALVQIWAVGVDFVLRRGLTAGGGFDLVFMGLVLALALSREPKLHGLVSGVIWLLFVVSVGLRGLGMIA